jgi:hypothetical protein
MPPRRIPSLTTTYCEPSRPIVLLCTAVACRSTPPLHSPQYRGQSLVAMGPAQRSLMVHACMCRLGRRLAPPVLCSSATHARLRALFTAWCMPSHGVVPQHSLPLQRGTDSHLVPKCAALHHVMAAVAVLESPRSRAREHACSAAAPSRHLPLSLLTQAP